MIKVGVSIADFPAWMASAVLKTAVTEGETASVAQKIDLLSLLRFLGISHSCINFISMEGTVEEWLST